MSGVTKYPEVREELLDRIDGLPAGEQLPSERVLAAELGVSRMTLRRAVDDLIVAGLVRRRAGAGVFTLGPKLDTSLAATSFTEDMVSRGLRPGARILGFERRPAGARVARRLEVSPSTEVVHISRLRLADDEPMSIEELYTPEALVPGLAAEDLENASYYALLRTRYGVIVTGGVQTIEPTVTDEEESRELEVPQHTPALLFERTTRGLDGAVVEFVRSVYRGDRYQIRTELSLPTGTRRPRTR